MMTTDEFTMTEAGAIAIVQTMHTACQALAELSRQMEAANEAIVILSHEVEDLRAHANASRGYIPGGYTPA